MPLPRITRQISPTASGLYLIAGLLAEIPVADRATAEAARPVAERFRQALAASELPPQPLLQHAIPLAAQAMSDRELAQTVLLKLLGPREAELLVPRVADVLRDVRQTLAPLPACSAERLELRLQPIWQQWDARGVGLLRSLGKFCGPQWIPDDVTVVPVHPLGGGGGLPHPSYNVVSLEAVLTNARDGVPEAARLAWLIAQLELERPAIQEPLHRDRIRYLAALALVPAALEAAHDMELCYPRADTLAAAVESWVFHTQLARYAQLEVNRADAVQGPTALAAQLAAWWRVLRESQLSWQAGLLALDQLVRQGQA